MLRCLASELKLIYHNGPAVAGTSVITPSAGVDTEGYGTCLFVVAIGAVTAGAATSIEVHQCDTSGGSYAALAGTNVAIADDGDNKLYYVEVCRPQEKFLKCIVNRATQNAVLDGIIAILGQPTKRPISNHTSLGGGEFHTSPAEGTA